VPIVHLTSGVTVSARGTGSWAYNSAIAVKLYGSTGRPAGGDAHHDNRFALGINLHNFGFVELKDQTSK
jgi:hypothetical protein